jgi:hypothetical protein
MKKFFNGFRGHFPTHNIPTEGLKLLIIQQSAARAALLPMQSAFKLFAKDETEKISKPKNTEKLKPSPRETNLFLF